MQSKQQGDDLDRAVDAAGPTLAFRLRKRREATATDGRDKSNGITKGDSLAQNRGIARMCGLVV
jgi:hypothetical protein